MDSIAPAEGNWRRHFNARSYAAFCILVALFAAAIGYGFYYSNLSWFKINKGEEKTSALQLVNAFVTTYSDVRGQYLNGDAPVPASFRAHAIDKFNQSRGSANALRLSMVGVPGREIVTAPSDAAAASAIEAFVGETKPTPTTQFVEINGEPVLRTIYPSIASQQSCVDCHNKLQAGRQTWKLNDVMGAFIAEVPAGSFLAQARFDAALAGFLVFMMAVGFGSYLFFSHAAQLARRARSEAQLRAAHEELQAAVDRLAVQERLAAIGQLAGTVSHELRNPLGVISSSLAVIKKMMADKNLGVDRLFERIDRSVERCAKIVGEILDYTRPRDLDREHVSIDSWLNSLLDEYHHVDGVTIQRDLRSGAEAVADAHRLHQVMTNLLDNACHALADPQWKPAVPGDRRITVRSESAGPHIRITVQDNGPGIAPDVLPKVFEPLFTTKSFGTGLGLPTVRNIVEQHGGTIEVESVAGQGATFTIRLPRQGAAIEPAPRLPAENAA